MTTVLVSPRVADQIEHGLAIDRIAVPFLAAERANRRIGIGVVGREGHLIGEQVPAGRRPVEAVEQPRLLGRTLDGPRRIERARTVAVDPFGQQALRRRAMRSVLPGVEHVHRQQVAELEPAIELQRRAGRQLRRAQRHVLVVRLVGARPTRREVGLVVGRIRGILRGEPGVVVLGFVVVPGHDPGNAA